MTWALKRQVFYLSILILFLLGLGYLTVAPYMNSIPSCTDNKKNGDEEGIDCGGSCSKACSFQVDQISIFWARSFQVIPGRYNAIAYLENHNKSSAISKIKYKFRFADKDNVYIGKREGETFIPPGSKFAIFEPGIGVGNSIPVYTTFEFTELPNWENVPKNILDKVKVEVDDIRLENKDSSPSLSAKITNNSLYTIPKMEVIALLYDEKGNAVSVSKTYLDVLNREEVKKVYFTWPEPIKENIVAKEIIPMYNDFLVESKW